MSKMYAFEIKPSLKKKLLKIKKKNPLQFKAVRNKIDEVVRTPHHYKNLRHDLKDLKRVHIGSFVLIFSVDKSERCVHFIDFEHHDTIYKR